MAATTGIGVAEAAGIEVAAEVTVDWFSGAMVGTMVWLELVGNAVLADPVGVIWGANWVVMAMTVSAAAVLTSFGPAVVVVALLVGRLQPPSNRAITSIMLTVARVLFISSPDFIFIVKQVTDE